MLLWRGVASRGLLALIVVAAAAGPAFAQGPVTSMTAIAIRENALPIVVDGDLSRVTQFMGGKPHPGKDRLSGHFGFCGHSDPVAFRRIQIKPVGKK